VLTMLTIWILGRTMNAAAWFLAVVSAVDSYLMVLSVLCTWWLWDARRVEVRPTVVIDFVVSWHVCGLVANR
jgi:hypothetical protein